MMVATSSGYDPQCSCFDTSSVDAEIRAVSIVNETGDMDTMSTIPVGYVGKERAELGTVRIAFSPEWLREGQTLCDKLHSSWIVDGEYGARELAFPNLLPSGAEEETVPLQINDRDEAEAVKLFTNKYLHRRWRSSTTWTATGWLMA